MAVLSDLEPKNVFEYFEKLCSVPHGSRNTRQISDLCAGFAKELGLRWRQDEVNNVVIWKEASPGYERAAPVILQGHMDMVCVKTEDCPKDMAREGIDLVTDGTWIWADRTSLGGDNGIAVAMILAILADGSLPHPPLEAVFTVDEEVGMDGAFALDCSDLKGRKLVNLDSGEEGVFTVSCAGGVRLDCVLPVEREPLADETVCRVTLDGLLGGHSGCDIHRGRACANQLMVRTLYSAMEQIPGLRLNNIRGGIFDNVICAESEALVAVPRDCAEDFEELIRDFDITLKNEYAGCDGGVTLTCTRGVTVEGALTVQATGNVLRALLTVPQGVQAMSMDFPNLVQTSLNLGVIRGVEGDGLPFSISVRSCIASQKEMLVQRVRAIVTGAGGTVCRRGDYPGWRYDRQSALRKDVMAAWRAVSGQEGRIAATHGGLECGLFLEKIPGLDAVSLGPELRGVHSTEEKLNVSSAGRVYKLVCELLRRSK